MDYSKLSDFEINKLVAHALGNVQVDQVHDEIGGSAVQYTVFKCSGLNREGFISASPCTVTKDFCNNPADAWSIIENRKISMLFNSIDWSVWHGDFPDVETSHQNPLRAAMIVFIMMQDSANVQDNTA